MVGRQMNSKGEVPEHGTRECPSTVPTPERGNEVDRGGRAEKKLVYEAGQMG